jgi:hypothetical protein
MATYNPNTDKTEHNDMPKVEPEISRKPKEFKPTPIAQPEPAAPRRNRSMTQEERRKLYESKGGKPLVYEDAAREAVLKTERLYPNESDAEKGRLLRAELLIRYWEAGQLGELCERFNRGEF